MRRLIRFTPSWVVLPSLIMVTLLALGGFVGSGTRLQANAQDASPAATPCPPGDPAANEALGRAYYDAVDDADVDAVAALVSSDHIHRWGSGQIRKTRSGSSPESSR